MPLSPTPQAAITYRPTYWYYPQGNSGSAAALTLNQVTYAPLRVENTRVFDQIGATVTIAGGSSSHTRLGIYSDANGVPATLILDAGVIPSSCAAGASVIAITQSLSPGIYWLAAVAQDGVAPTARVLQLANPIIGLSTLISLFASGYVQTAVTGALPAVATPAAAEAGTAASVMLRAQ